MGFVNAVEFPSSHKIHMQSMIQTAQKFPGNNLPFHCHVQQTWRYTQHYKLCQSSLQSIVIYWHSDDATHTIISFVKVAYSQVLFIGIVMTDEVS